MRKYILIAVIVFLAFSAKAQGGYNYNQFGFGISASAVRPFADLRKNYTDYSLAANLTYYYNPYVPIVVEFQTGKLRGGGDAVSDDKDTRKFNNNFKAFLLYINYGLGDAIDYDRSAFLSFVKNFYGGIGVGFIFNNVKVNRNSLLQSDYVFPGKDKSVNFTVPLRIGYEIKIYDDLRYPKFGIDFGYQHNITFGEGLDGYADPTSKFKNNSPDQYRQFTIGLKYNFGSESSYYK